MVPRLAFAFAFLLVGCGRSSLLDSFEESRPGADLSMRRDGFILDGGRDIGVADMRDGGIPDLRGADLRGRDLATPVDLRGADLRGIDLSTPVDLRGADLRGIDLSTPVDLRGADLRGLDLRPPDLTMCSAIEICGNFKDDDCDGATDCEDSTCQPLPECINMRTEDCTNRVDDDNNGFTDCMDPACFGHPACFVPGREICNNLLDDDGDGFIDCFDNDCATSPACRPPGMEICNNGIDDDGDALVDCADPACVAFPACIEAACDPEIDFGAIAQHGANVTRVFDTVGAVRSYNVCAPPGGTARVGRFTLAAVSDVKLDFAQPSGAAHVVSVNRAGVNQSCDQNTIACLRVGQMPTATRTFAALPAGTYWVIVQSFPGTQGRTTVTLSTGVVNTPEICNNGKDDDGDGLLDCADSDCAAAPNCVNTICKPDFNVGSVVVGDSGRVVSFDTNNFTDRFHPVCTGTSTGKDVVVKFTLHETATVNVEWFQTGDHFILLAGMPGPGQKCDANALRCFYPGGRQAGIVSYAPRPPGDYLFIVKASATGREGQVRLRIFASQDRQREICNNRIDDDANGLVDCEDPACVGVGECGAPICTPDVNLGDFDWGTVKSTTVDTTNAPNLYATTCAFGDGNERVVRINLLKPMALGTFCNFTGDHVVQLGQQVNPLDRCDANVWRCVDPRIFPSGCNWYFPNLQPGLYNIILEAFQPGSEGVVNLTLVGVEERILENCNNGIDDDMDGFTDCNDRKCVTEPECLQNACRVDTTMGLIPLDGNPTSAVVQTQGRGDDQQNSTCAAGAGGEDAVVSFSLPAATDLKIEWAQAGNHVFAIYQVVSDLLACEANLLVDCRATNGAATGSVTVSLQAEKYIIVVDANQAGQAGGVVLQLSGLPR